jgi:hypothetical protein
MDVPKGTRTRVLRDTTNSQDKTLQLLHAKKKAPLPKDSDLEHNKSYGRGNREYANRPRDSEPPSDANINMDNSFMQAHTDSNCDHMHEASSFLGNFDHSQDEESGQNHGSLGELDAVVASVRPYPRDRGVMLDPVIPTSGQGHMHVHEGGTVVATMRPNVRERGPKLLPTTHLTNTRKTKR